MIKLWGSGTARTLRPIWMAEELEMEYELIPIGPRTGETKTEEFTQINPKQKIPALEDSEIKLSESLAICRYLQRNFKSKNIFLPKNTTDIAKEDEWCNFIYGESPIVVEACRKYLIRQLEVVENHLKLNQTVLEGGFGLADIFLISCLDWAVFYEFSLPKNITEYRDRISSRSAYQKAMKINYST